MGLYLQSLSEGVSIITNEITQQRDRFMIFLVLLCGRLGSLMISALVSRLSDLGWSPGRKNCFVFFGKTINEAQV